jgi:hypothetical protein
MLLIRPRLFVVFAAAVIAAWSPTVRAVEIESGWDWITAEDGTRVQIPDIGNVPLEGVPPTWPPGDLFPNPPSPPGGPVAFQVAWPDPLASAVAPDFTLKITDLVAPIGGSWPFCMAVERKADATLNGVGDEAIIPIEIIWLSLKSIDPVTVGGDQYDVYVGLHPGNQIQGEMKLVSGTDSGEAGTVDLGVKGVTTDNPTDPDFLGLPVTYDALFIPHGLDPILANVDADVSLYGQSAVFQGSGDSPLGSYTVPEPATLFLLTLGGLGLGYIRRQWRN